MRKQIILGLGIGLSLLGLTACDSNNNQSNKEETKYQITQEDYDKYLTGVLIDEDFTAVMNIYDNEETDENLFGTAKMIKSGNYIKMSSSYDYSGVKQNSEMFIVIDGEYGRMFNLVDDKYEESNEPTNIKETISSSSSEISDMITFDSLNYDSKTKSYKGKLDMSGTSMDLEYKFENQKLISYKFITTYSGGVVSITTAKYTYEKVNLEIPAEIQEALKK